MAHQVFFINAPERCDVCDDSFDQTMYDARSAFGPWANMCEGCWKDAGSPLGTGRGQKYKLQPDGKWLKVAG